MQAASLRSSPAADRAVDITRGVMIGEFALVILHSSISQGMTVSTWCWRRRAVLVTSLGSRAEETTSPEFPGSTRIPVRFLLTHSYRIKETYIGREGGGDRGSPSS